MNSLKIIGIILIIVSVTVGIFGVWLKSYNDKIAQTQINETGTCYLPDGTCIHATSDNIMYVAVGIAVFLAALGVFLILKKKEPQKVVVKRIIEKQIVEKPAEKKEPAFVEAPKTLGPESRQIFDIVKDAGGAVLQGEIVSKSGMDKVKVSRILDKLEMQGLIERRRHGMSNMVVLKKK